MPGKNMFDDEHSAESKNGILIVGQVVGLSIPFLDARHREAKEKIGGEIKYIEPLLETLLEPTITEKLRTSCFSIRLSFFRS